MGFFDGGGKTVKFEAVNQGASGYIVGQAGPGGKLVPYTESQQTDFTTKEPAVYKDGNPIMQAIVLIQTDQRDDDDDDGQRTIYVNKTRMKRAIQKALKEAGVGDLQIGGVLTMWMLGTEPSKGGGSPAKTFAATYSAPIGGLAVAAPPAPAVAYAAPVAVAAPPAPVAAVAPPAPVAAPPAPVAAPPAPVAASPAPVAAPPAPVAAPPVAVAPVAPPAPPAPPAAPLVPTQHSPAPVEAPAMAMAQGDASDLPF